MDLYRTYRSDTKTEIIIVTRIVKVYGTFKRLDQVYHSKQEKPTIKSEFFYATILSSQVCLLPIYLQLD